MHWNPEMSLWAGGIALHILLLAVLFACSRIRRFPFFTLLIFFYVLRSLALYVTYNRIARGAYTEMRLGLALTDVVLETLVLLGLAWQGLKGAGFTPRFAIPGSFVGLVVAASLPIFWGEWPAMAWPGSAGFDWTMLASVIANKGNLFVQALAIVVALAVLVSSRKTGLRWTNHIRRLLQGFSVYALVSIAASALIQHLETTLKPTTLQEYQAALTKLRNLSMLPTVVYFLVVVYWIVTLWMPDGPQQHSEPLTVDESPELLSAPEVPAKTEEPEAETH